MLKQRCISGFIGLVFYFLALRMYDVCNGFVFGCILGLLSATAATELLSSARVKARPAYIVLSIAVAFFIPCVYPIWFDVTCLLAGAYILVLCAGVVRNFGQFTFRELSVCVFSSLVVPLAFSQMGQMGTHLFLMYLCAAVWGNDIGAFLFGIRYGKTKLCPKLSPKKTVEGFIGGILMAVAAGTGLGFLILTELPDGASYHVLPGILVLILAALAGAIGDLFASAVKRECRIKDFGSIIPGHGGVLDRFDSLLYACPVVCALLRILPVFTDSTGNNLFAAMLSNSGL